MLNTLLAMNELASAVLPLAPAPEPTGGLDSQGIVTWVLKNIIPLVLLFIGLGVIWSAKKGDYSRVMATVGIIVIGFIILGSTAFLRAFADNIAGIIFQ